METITLKQGNFSTNFCIGVREMQTRDLQTGTPVDLNNVPVSLSG